MAGTFASDEHTAEDAVPREAPYRLDAERADVAAFRQRLGLTHLIDVHTRFMPVQLLARVWAYFETGGPLVGDGWSIAYRQPEQ